MSFVVAFGVVEWFLMWVRKHGFTVFAIYRIVIGIVLLIWGARIFGGWCPTPGQISSLR